MNKNVLYKYILNSYLKSTYLTWTYKWPIKEFTWKDVNISISWSWWKDSCYVLYKAMQLGFRIDSLFTVIDSKTKMSLTMPYNIKLLEEQAKSIWLPLYKLEIDADITYTFNSFLKVLCNKWVNSLWFGYFIKEWQREFIQKLAYKQNLSIFEPNLLINQEVRLLEILSTWITPKIVWIIGNNINKSFLWKNVDIKFYKYLKTKFKYNQFCWENGDFQTFIINAPFFKTPIVLKDYYEFNIKWHIINYYL